MSKIQKKANSKTSFPESQNIRNVFDLNKIQLLQHRFSEATGASSAILDNEGNLMSFSGSNKRFFSQIVNQPDQMSGFINFLSEGSALRPMIITVDPCGLIEAGGRIMVGEVCMGNWWIGLIRTKEPDRNEADMYAGTLG